jgi:hypothetical protein
MLAGLDNLMLEKCRSGPVGTFTVAQFIQQGQGEIPGELQLDDEGERMPVFSFEKISPPVRRPIAPTARKQGGIIVQILDRLAEARVRHSLREDKAAIMTGKRKARE